MKGGKQHLLVLVRNPNSLIADDAKNISGIALDSKTDARSRFGVFHRVAQEIVQNMYQQSFVRVRLSQGRAQGKFDRASVVGGGKDFVHNTPAKAVQVQRRRLKI